MKEYLSTSIINAPLETVWAILTDGNGYADWNPEIVKIDGPTPCILLRDA